MTRLVSGWLHQAQADPVTQKNGVTYYLGGRIVYRVSGYLLTERNLDTNTVVLAGGRLVAAPQGADGRLLGTYDTSRDLTIRVLGGYLSAHQGSGAGGFLYTRFSQPDAPDRGVAFFFSPLPFGRYRNAFRDAALDEFNFWGNNTVDADGAPVDDPALRIGLDLHTTAENRRAAG